jgi:hypothetical protein
VTGKPGLAEGVTGQRMQRNEPVTPDQRLSTARQLPNVIFVTHLMLCTPGVAGKITLAG